MKIPQLRRSLALPQPRIPTPVVMEPVTGPPPLTYHDARREDEAVPFALRVAAAVSWRVILVCVALYGLVRLLEITRSVMIPVAVALLLTSLVMPVAVFLNHKLRFPRALAALVTVFGSLALVGGLLYIAGNQLFLGVQELGGQVNTGVGQVQEWLENGPLQMGGQQLSATIAQAQAWVRSNSQALTSGALAGAVTAGEFVAGTIMMLFAMFFFIADGDRIWAWCVRLAPRETRTPIHEAGRRGWISLSSYVKTQVVVAATDAVLIAAGAAALGLPLAVPLGLIIFFAAAVPLVGAVVSGVLAVLLALVVKGVGSALIMLAIVLAVQQFEGNVLHPILMSKAVSLHPLATLLGVAVGSYTFGIAGALFAVPVMAVGNTVILYLNGHDKFPMLAREGSILTDSPKDLGADKVTEAEGDLAAEPPIPESKRIGDISPEHLGVEQATADAQAAAIEKGMDDTRDA